MSKVVKVASLPNCDVCGDDTPAQYDAKTTMGPWANMCKPHFMQLGVGLGAGFGQKFEVA